MAITPVSATITVATAGTQIQCTSDADIKPASVYFEALHTNTGAIYIGLSDCSSTLYIAKLEAGEGFSLGSGLNGAAPRIGGQGIQLSALWIDSETNGEAVRMTYLPIAG